MKRTAAALAIALAVPVVSLSAFADKAPDAAQKKASAADAGDRHDPDNVTGISLYMETVVKGNERYAAKDFTAAIDLYKKAIVLAPRNPLAHYLLGEAYLATNNLPEAEAASHQAAEVSDSKNAAAAVLRSHVLFAVADCFERAKKWTEAKAAWQAYNEHAAKLPDAGAFPASGAARVSAIDKMLEREKVYAAVRERIAAEKDGGAKAAHGDAGAQKK